MKLFFNLKTMGICLSLVTIVFTTPALAEGDSDNWVGYKIKTVEGDDSTKGVAVNCYNKDKGAGDQSICDKNSSIKNASCEAIESTLTFDEPIYMCNPPGESYCFKDTDCKVLGKNTCVTKPGSTNRFESQFDDDGDIEGAEKIGICVSVGGSGEDNAFGQAICNLMNVITGNAGRAVVGVVVIVVGIMFFLGKVTWSLVLAIALGAGAIFGAPAVVKIVTGKAFTC